ncbi:MAG: transferase family-domain-containing protein [Benniella sp.]|nr:MAG: transferase family-domain-containing protein [Benniella sp.]
MTPDRAPQEPEKSGARYQTYPSSTFAASTSAFSAGMSSSVSSNSRPTTKLRYRQLVQPITPTELEPVNENEQTATDRTTQQDDSTSTKAMRHPRLALSSLDLAKPRIYTRLLYFFHANDSTDAPILSPISPDLSELSPDMSSSGRGHKRTSSKSRHHYHYHQSPFMDPMLLQASLALVLSDFFPLAGRICYNDHQPVTLASGQRPYIECNDRGVLFAVADTNVTMEQIRLGGYQDTVLPPRLFPVGLYPASLHDPPLLAIQVTYTQDRSLIMGVAVDSCAMDGVSLVSFMDAWSKITQGKDFEPYPILDRSFLEKYGEAHGPNGVYRHHRINDSPPPPIAFDNALDGDLARGLADSDMPTDDDDDDSEEDEDEDEAADIEDGSGVLTEQQRSNIKRIHKQMKAMSMVGSAKASGSVAMADVHRGSRSGRSAGAVDTSDSTRSQSPESEGGALYLIHFTPEQLDRIKKLASEQNIAAAACAADDKEISDKWVSTGDSLIAYLWKISTITRRMEPDCKLMCGVVMDIRDRVEPAIPKGLIGNAILNISVQMPVHSLLTTPLSLPSRLLRDELMLQTPEQICSSISWIQKQEHPHLIETDSNNPFGHDFTVWSYRKLDLYSPDFGQGRPCKVRIGRGGIGAGEGMCIIMDSEPPSTTRRPIGTSKSATETRPCGVDVYMGLQGEQLQDFFKVHRGFMNGLLESDNGSSSTGGWEFV